MKIIYVHCGLRNDSKSDLRNNDYYLKKSESKAWKKKNLGLYGIWTHGLYDTGAVLSQLACWLSW